MSKTKKNDQTARNGKPLFVFLGNIGSGKTTLTTALYSQLMDNGAVLIEEPVKNWRECGFLQEFYSDMNKYALSFQMFALATRAKLYKETDWSLTNLGIADGHIISDRFVFALNLRHHNILTENELNWYDTAFKGWESIVPEMNATYWIYLKATPNTCQKRIKTRGRIEENDISLSYLEGLDKLFEKLLEKFQESNNMKIFDAELDIGSVQEAVLNFMKSVLQNE